MGGNFIYVREEPVGGFAVIHSGEGENLLTGARQRWSDAEREHGATHLFTRLNISQSVRQHEHADLSDHYQPPMTASWSHIKAAPAAPPEASSRQPEA